MVDGMTDLTVPRSAFPGRVERRGSLKITVGEIRVVMRESMFPTMVRYADDSIILAATVVEGKGPISAIRSEDGGQMWRPMAREVSGGEVSGAAHKNDYAAFGVGANAVQLKEGPVLTVSVYTTPIAGQPGWYRTTRWECEDGGRRVRGPFEDGRMFLPPEKFDPEKVQWFHGNIIELPDGRLLSAMQGVEKSDQPRYPFWVYLTESVDRGKTWTFVSVVASMDSLENPSELTRHKWKLHGLCEPSIMEVGDGQLVCVMRTINDDLDPLMGPVSDTYRDLSYQIPAEGIYPGRSKAPGGKYVSLGPPSSPLVITYSSDGGKTWSKGRAMKEGRGCFPRMAKSEGLLALVYGGLTFPRWGNCIAFSTDGGLTWTDEINFGPFLTTGYTDVMATGPGRFLCVFDCTPPQPWTNHAAHWVGAVDVEVEFD